MKMGDWVVLAIGAAVIVIVIASLWDTLNETLNDPCANLNMTAEATCPPPAPYHPFWMNAGFLILILGMGVILAFVGVFSVFINAKYGDKKT